MSYLKTGDPEALVQCPYNDTHMVRNKRIQYHLIDCRKQHMGSEMKTCPYNAKHVHPSMEHQFHLVHCTDRTLIDRDIIYNLKAESDQGRLTGNTSVPSYNSVLREIPASEDWDTETTTETFSLNENLAVQCKRQARHCEDSAPVKLRMPRAEPDALRSVDESVIEQRKQPRQPNAEPSSLNVGSSYGAVNAMSMSSFGRGRLLAMSATSQSGMGGAYTSPMGRGCGRASVPLILASNTTSVGQARLLNGVGRGCSTVDDQASQYTHSLQMSNSQPISGMSSNGTERQVDRLAPHHHQSSMPVSNTQVQPESVKQRVATATPAFSLNGVGRGKMVSPPSASELPLPVFGRGQLTQFRQNDFGVNGQQLFSAN